MLNITPDLPTVPLESVGTEILHRRLVDSELRVLICTATYFVQDGVTVTIRKLESYLKSRGACVKILSTVPESIDSELLKDFIVVPGIKIPFEQAGDYSFGAGLDQETLRKIEEFNPNIVHFTVPDLVGLDGVKWCQEHNVAHIGTWHSNYCDYLPYHYLDWTLGHMLPAYLKEFYERIPTVYITTPNVRLCFTTFLSRVFS